MIALPPVPITTDSNGVPQLATIEFEAARRPTSIKLANETPYGLKVQISGLQDWLGPWTADLFPVSDDAAGAVLSPVPIAAAAPAPPSSAVLATLGFGGEVIPGVYPVALVRQAAGFSQQTLLGSLTVANGNTASKYFSLPAGSNTVFAFCESSFITLLELSGSESGYKYALINHPGVRGLYQAELLTFIDVNVRLYLENFSGGGSGTVDVGVSPVPLPRLVSQRMVLDDSSFINASFTYPDQLVGDLRELAIDFELTALAGGATAQLFIDRRAPRNYYQIAAGAVLNAVGAKDSMHLGAGLTTAVSFGNIIRPRVVLTGANATYLLGIVGKP